MQELVVDAGGLADVGLLLLRLVVGLLIIGHAVQKSFGWLDGDGLTTTAASFDRVGYSPGRPMVVIASIAEIVGSLLPLTFSVVAATLALTGAGGWSVDGLVGLVFPVWVPVVSLLAGCLGAAGLIGIRALLLRRDTTEPHVSTVN